MPTITSVLSDAVGGAAVCLIDVPAGDGVRMRAEGAFLVTRYEWAIDNEQIDVSDFGSPWRETIAARRCRIKLELVDLPGREGAKLSQAKKLAHAVLFGDPDAVFPMIDAFLAETEPGGISSGAAR